MIQKVLETIRKHNLIAEGDKIIVGVSGGPDSICLLHILHSIAPLFHLTIHAVHINHLLRGKESDADAEYVGEFCSKLGIELYTYSFDIHEMAGQRGISPEEAGREARYKQFDSVADRVGADRIAVAHNRNDQAETVLMHMMRGSGLDGLKGMDYKRGRIIRPLLDIDRKDIEEYCREKSLNPRTDSSNLESIYTRNKVRLDLIPLMERVFGVNMADNVHRMTLLLKDDAAFIDKTAFEYYEECVLKREERSVWMDSDKIMQWHPALQRRIIRKAVSEVKGDLKEVESVHIEKAVELAAAGRTGSLVHLPGSVRVEKSYNALKVYCEHKTAVFPEFCEPVKIPGTTLIEILDISVEAFTENSEVNLEHYTNLGYNALVQFFDYEKIKTGINIRNRRDGDIFKPYKSKGTKKLKEYFIDNKVPREQRGKIPLVAAGNEIVWIIGYKISDKFKVTENTKSVLKLEVKPTVR